MRALLLVIFIASIALAGEEVIPPDRTNCILDPRTDRLLCLPPIKKEERKNVDRIEAAPKYPEVEEIMI